MKSFEPTAELLEVAERVVWFKEPHQTLNDSIHFLTYAMRFGTAEDLAALDRAGINLTHFGKGLDNAPAGIFDERSWAYWNLKCGRKVVPPLPVRNLDLE